MKTCSQCQQEKPESAFGPDKKATGGLRRNCNTCKNETYKLWWHEKSGKEKRAATIQRDHDYVYNLLQHSQCADCGDTRWEVLEFDHVKGEKKNNIATMIHKGYALSTIQEEIDKCQVVCASCHRLRTYRRSGTRGLYL